MSLVYKDRVGQLSATTGTGTYSLSSAIAGFQGFDAIGTGNQTHYVARMGEVWEVALGTLTVGSPSTLSRDVILDSSTGAAINWEGGNKSIFCTQPAAAIVSYPRTAAEIAAGVTPTDYGFEPGDVRRYGAVIDNVADDAAALTDAAAACVAGGYTLFSPPASTVYIASEVDLRNIRDIDFRSAIRADPAIVGVPVTVGGFGGSATGSNWRFENITDGTSTIVGGAPSRPLFRIYGSRGSEVHVGSCNYVQMWADAAVTGGTSNAYNRVYLNGAVRKLGLEGAVGVSWNNENRFYGGRLKELLIDGTNYRHNHNFFYDSTFEGSDVEIEILGGWNNHIISARFENTDASPGITFDALAYSNIITRTWSSNPPRSQFAVGIPVSDSGQQNMVTTVSAEKFRKVPLFSVGANSVILGTATDSTAPSVVIAPGNDGIDNFTTRALLTPELKGFVCTAANRYVALTDLVPVSLGDTVVFDTDFDGSVVRTPIFVYDADQNPLLDNSGGEFVSQVGATFNATYGRYSRTADATAVNINAASATVLRAEVKFIRVGIHANTATLVRHLSAALYVQTLGRSTTEGAAMIAATRSLNGTPTKGYAPLFTTIWDRTASAMRVCTFRYETTVDGALVATDTSVTVTAATGVADGDIVGILMDNDITHWTTVAALSGATFTIAAIPTGRSVADNARIVFNRWV